MILNIASTNNDNEAIVRNNKTILLNNGNDNSTLKYIQVKGDNKEKTV